MMRRVRLRNSGQAVRRYLKLKDRWRKIMRSTQSKDANREQAVWSMRSFLAAGRGWVPLGLAGVFLTAAVPCRAEFGSAPVLGYVRGTAGASVPNAAGTVSHPATSIAHRTAAGRAG